MILSYGASGTNAVFDQLLNNNYLLKHKEKEPLNKNNRIWSNTKVLKRTQWYNSHLITMSKKAESRNKKLLIHIKPSHFDLAGVSIQEAVEIFKDDFNFIFIRRNNYLARISSALFKQARKTDGKEKVIIRGKNILKRLKKFDKINNEIQKCISPFDHFYIDYEKDLHKNIRETMNKLCNHFNIFHDYKYVQNRQNYHGSKNKWSNIKLKDKIENFEELKKILKGTKWEWMLWE